MAAEQGAAVSGIDRSLCPGCGYWLAGPIGNLPGRRCPHCGYVNEHARAERTLGPGDRVALDERARLLERSSIVPNIRDNEPPAPRTLSNNQRAEWAAILQQCGYAEREIERIVREWEDGGDNQRRARARGSSSSRLDRKNENRKQAAAAWRACRKRRRKIKQFKGAGRGRNPNSHYNFWQPRK